MLILRHQLKTVLKNNKLAMIIISKRCTQSLRTSKPNNPLLEIIMQTFSFSPLAFLCFPFILLLGRMSGNYEDVLKYFWSDVKLVSYMHYWFVAYLCYFPKRVVCNVSFSYSYWKVFVILNDTHVNSYTFLFYQHVILLSARNDIPITAEAS